MINNEESTTEEPVNHDQHLTNFLNSLTYPLNIPDLLNQQLDDEEISDEEISDESNQDTTPENSLPSMSIFQQYLINRIEQEINANRIEEQQLAQALLESREYYDEHESNQRKDNVLININSQKYSSVKIKDKRKEICAICQEKYSCNNQVYWLDCKHIYHKDCLDEWIKYNPSCPICKKDIEIIN